jgi:hypothetical protein
VVAVVVNGLVLGVVMVVPVVEQVAAVDQVVLVTLLKDILVAAVDLLHGQVLAVAAELKEQVVLVLDLLQLQVLLDKLLVMVALVSNFLLLSRIL